jgi:hypothetical protein
MSAMAPRSSAGVADSRSDYVGGHSRHWPKTGDLLLRAGVRQAKSFFCCGVALRASDRLDEPAASFRDAFGSREVAALIIDDGFGVGHVVGEPLAMLGGHEHVG